jgi:hypothetical protein
MLLSMRNSLVQSKFRLLTVERGEGRAMGDITLLRSHDDDGVRQQSSGRGRCR